MEKIYKLKGGLQAGGTKCTNPTHILTHVCVFKTSQHLYIHT